MNDRIQILRIHQYLTGQLDAAQEAALETWIAGSAENEALFEEIRTIWTRTSPPGNVEFASDPAFQDFLHRSGLKSKPAKKQVFWSLQRIAAVIFALVVTGSIFYWYIQRPTWQTYTYATNDAAIHLPDGSLVRLGKDASLRCPDRFSGARRTVELQGDAFFSVSHNPEAPFVVESENTVVTVLGTEFLIEEVRHARQSKVYVKSGMVRFQPRHSAVFLQVGKGQAAVYDRNQKVLDRLEKPDLNVFYPYDGKLSFIDQPVSKVLESLETYYGVEIDDAGTDILDCRFTASLVYDNPSLEELLRSLEVAFRLQIDRAGDTIRLSGGTCD